MVDLASVRSIAQERGVNLPAWVLEATDEAVDRIRELEGLYVSGIELHDEMFAVLKFYADQPNGERAREITER